VTAVEGWKTKKLTDLADYVNGAAFGPDDWGKEGLPIVRIEQLKNPTAPTDHYAGNLPAKNLIDNGDLVFSWSASLFLKIWRNGPAALNQHLFKVLEKPGVDREFLKFFIEFHLDEITKASHGSTMQHITRKELDRFSAPFPEDVQEQTEIVRILFRVDKAIEQTAAIIAKQQRIKTGLMQDLLTRGIDEHGNIRTEATHAFKDSPLGRIPAEWELKSLSDAFAMPPRNGIYKPAQQIGEGSLLIGQNAFTRDGTLDYALARRAFVNAAELETFGLQEGDLLVSRVFATADGVGKPVTVSDLPEPAVYESNMLRLRFNTDCVHPGFVFHWLLSHQMRLAITSSVNASNQVSINQKTLNTLPIVIPKKCEQERILGVIVTATEAQLDLKRSLVKLRRNKSALMQDLLTGKVRVTPLLEAGA